MSVHLPLFVMLPILAGCIWAMVAGVRSLRDALKLMEAERQERERAPPRPKRSPRAPDANGLA